MQEYAFTQSIFFINGIHFGPQLRAEAIESYFKAQELTFHCQIHGNTPQDQKEVLMFACPDEEFLAVL